MGNEFNLIERYVGGSKIIMKFDSSKSIGNQYEIARICPEGQLSVGSYASADNAARIVLVDLVKDIYADLRMSAGGRIATALHWLGLLDEGVDVVVLTSPDNISSDAWQNSDFVDLVVYDCSDNPAPCIPAIPRKSLLIGKNANRIFVKWAGPVDERLKLIFAESSRIAAAHELKMALANINPMLSDPDYSSTMKGDTLPKCAAALSMLSFGKCRLEYGGYSYEGQQSYCEPPDDFTDELAEHMNESSERLSSLLAIWKAYAEVSPIRFAFPFDAVMNNPRPITDIAETIGIKDAVDAYLSGVPLADVLA